jgi:putative Mg2+ transporter-C (MgtC) family protein
MACGGNLPLVAASTTAIYLVVTYAFPFLVRLLPRSRFAASELRLVYVDGMGLLREALEECAQRGFSISDLSVTHETNGNGRGEVTVELEVRGQGSVAELASDLNELEGVMDVRARDGHEVLA